MLGRPSIKRDRRIERVRLLPKLTVDYYFIKAYIEPITLHLLDNKSLGLKTDHKYTISLTLPSTFNGSSITTSLDAGLKRYRTKLLYNEGV